MSVGSYVHVLCDVCKQPVDLYEAVQLATELFQSVFAGSCECYYHPQCVDYRVQKDPPEHLKQYIWSSIYYCPSHYAYAPKTRPSVSQTCLKCGSPCLEGSRPQPREAGRPCPQDSRPRPRPRPKDALLRRDALLCRDAPQSGVGVGDAAGCPLPQEARPRPRSAGRPSDAAGCPAGRGGGRGGEATGFMCTACIQLICRSLHATMDESLIIHPLRDSIVANVGLRCGVWAEPATTQQGFIHHIVRHFQAEPCSASSRMYAVPCFRMGASSQSGPRSLNSPRPQAGRQGRPAPAVAEDSFQSEANRALAGIGSGVACLLHFIHTHLKAAARPLTQAETSQLCVPGWIEDQNRAARLAWQSIAAGKSATMRLFHAFAPGQLSSDRRRIPVKRHDAGDQDAGSMVILRSWSQVTSKEALKLYLQKIAVYHGVRESTIVALYNTAAADLQTFVEEGCVLRASLSPELDNVVFYTGTTDCA